jgi:hypothetical protein
MTKKVKVLLAVGLVMLSFTVVYLSAMTYCNIYGGVCMGLCGCEGNPKPYGGDPCCFQCENPGVELICCHGIGPWDGCFEILP